jgi:hypothetical protein
MNPQSTHKLKTRLQTEAAADAPAFSPLLHERIMQTLRTRASAPAPLAAARGPFWTYAAASLLLAAAGITFYIYQPATVAPQKIVQIPTPIELSTPVQNLLTPAVQSVDDAKYAYLDHDAKNFVTFLASQLPSTPNAQPK